MFDIVGKRSWFFLISGLLVLISIVSLATFRLEPSIEFSSGSMLTIHFDQEVKQDDLRVALADLGYSDALIQRTGSGDYIIRTRELNNVTKTALENGLTAKFGKLTEAEFDSVSPIVAGETVRNAGIAVLLAAVGILIYMTIAFSKMPNPIRYGTTAIIALLHDSLIALGAFSIFGALFNWQINLMFVTGILAIIGYSVNNIVVVYDRIRENIKRSGADFGVIVNDSLVETLGRCLNTSITTLIVLLALALFVGASIQNFVIVLSIGVIVGTFDSICVAPLLVLTWSKGDWSRLLPWNAEAKGR